MICLQSGSRFLIALFLVGCVRETVADTDSNDVESLLVEFHNTYLEGTDYSESVTYPKSDAYYFAWAGLVVAVGTDFAFIVTAGHSEVVVRAIEQSSTAASLSLISAKAVVAAGRDGPNRAARDVAVRLGAKYAVSQTERLVGSKVPGLRTGIAVYLLFDAESSEKERTAELVAKGTEVQRFAKDIALSTASLETAIAKIANETKRREYRQILAAMLRRTAELTVYRQLIRGSIGEYEVGKSLELAINSVVNPGLGTNYTVDISFAKAIESYLDGDMSRSDIDSRLRDAIGARIPLPSGASAGAVAKALKRLQPSIDSLHALSARLNRYGGGASKRPTLDDYASLLQHIPLSARLAAYREVFDWSPNSARVVDPASSRRTATVASPPSARNDAEYPPMAIGLPKPPASAVSGRVWSGANPNESDPIDGARVFALSSESELILAQTTTSSGKGPNSGRYQLAGLPARGKAILVAFHPGQPLNIAIEEVALDGRFKNDVDLTTNFDSLTALQDGTESDYRAGPLSLLMAAGWFADRANGRSKKDRIERLTNRLMQTAGNPRPPSIETPARFQQSATIPFGRMDTILVLDTSSSMNEVWDGDTRLHAAQRAASQLVGLVRLSSATGTSDRAGIARFSTSAEPAMLPTTNWTALNDRINALEAIGRTNIGAGVTVALDMAAASGSGCRIVLLSDGQQTEGMTPDEIVSGPVVEAVRRNIAIFTVGIGDPGDLDEELLRQIADATGARYYHASDAQQLSAIYRRAQHEGGGNVVVDEQPVVRQDETTAGIAFVVPPGTPDIRCSLSWPGSDLDIVLTSPTGIAVNQDDRGVVRQQIGAQEYLVVRNPAPGAWRVAVFGKSVPEGSISSHLLVSLEMKETLRAAGAPRNLRHPLLDATRFVTLAFVCGSGLVLGALIWVARKQRPKRSIRERANAGTRERAAPTTNSTNDAS